ncbi:hypothetical protein COO60DRAFT_105598 [Scenedesmus sp. NREL 46B-D3]|nr:hypothetical protein COO60DRAFT_105598 [Scenedesmus sp. NREL 46B-D3]
MARMWCVARTAANAGCADDATAHHDHDGLSMSPHALMSEHQHAAGSMLAGTFALQCSAPYGAAACTILVLEPLVVHVVGKQQLTPVVNKCTARDAVTAAGHCSSDASRNRTLTTTPPNLFKTNPCNPYMLSCTKLQHSTAGMASTVDAPCQRVGEPPCCTCHAWQLLVVILRKPLTC